MSEDTVSGWEDEPNVFGNANVEALYLVTLLKNCRKGGDYDQQARNETAERLRRRIPVSKDFSWGAFFSQGLVQTVMSLIFEDGLCGYPKIEVHHWATEPRHYLTHIKYAFDLLCIFVMTLNELPVFLDRVGSAGDLAPYKEHVYKTSDFVLAHSARYWSIVYEFRDVFFSLAVRKELESDPQDMDDIFSLTADNVIVLQKLLNRLTPDAHMEYILLLNWIHAKGIHTRKSIFQTLEILLQFRWAVDEHAYINFCNFVTSRVTSADDIIRCLCRDYRSEEYIDEYIRSLTLMLLGLRPDEPMLPRPLKTDLDYRLFHSVLAAGRRQMCRGSEDHDIVAHSCLSMLRYIFTVVTSTFIHTDRGTISTLSERSIHAIVPFLSMVFLLIMSDAFFEITAKVWKKTMDNCVKALELMRRRRTKPPSQRLKAMRWCTIWTCKHHIQEVGDNPEMDRPKYHDTSRTWFDLLKATPDQMQNVNNTQWQFPVLERCARRTCMCHYHKPAHHMRICHGCWSVAYCGVRCQERDWEHGDHKDKCRKLKHARMS